MKAKDLIKYIEKNNLEEYDILADDGTKDSILYEIEIKYDENEDINELSKTFILRLDSTIGS